MQAVLQKLNPGDIYEAEYEAGTLLAFVGKDLVDGKCPDLAASRVDLRKNYFFRMSTTAQLQQWIEDNLTFIRPETRREVLGYLRKDVGDLVFRDQKNDSWGISLPFDDEYVTYVWFDALLIISPPLAVVPTLAPEAQPGFKQHWPGPDANRDILTTHSVYWSTMLFAPDWSRQNARLLMGGGLLRGAR